jgi:hypothetical protein
MIRTRNAAFAPSPRTVGPNEAHPTSTSAASFNSVAIIVSSAPRAQRVAATSSTKRWGVPPCSTSRLIMLLLRRSCFGRVEYDRVHERLEKARECVKAGRFELAAGADQDDRPPQGSMPNEQVSMVPVQRVHPGIVRKQRTHVPPRHPARLSRSALRPLCVLATGRPSQRGR